MLQTTTHGPSGAESKGKKVYVEGRLQTRKWQDKEGRDRWTTEVVAHEVKFLSPKSEGAPNGQARPQPQGGGYGGGDYDQSDVPF